MPTTRHPLFTASGKPIPLPSGQVERGPRCAWCQNTERRALRPAFTADDILILECISEDACNTRFIFPEAS